MLITRAPWSAAQAIPSAMSAALPAPLPPITLTGISEHCEQAPTPPMPLFERAAITPATSVPCPWSSLASASSLTASQPSTKAPWRSGWLRSTPVSSTATTTSAAPLVTRHAAGARTLASDQESRQSGSFGAGSAATGRGRAFRFGLTGLRTAAGDLCGRAGCPVHVRREAKVARKQEREQDCCSEDGSQEREHRPCYRRHGALL